MSIQTLVGFALTVSIFLGVLAIGIRVAPADLPYVLSRPSRLARSLLAMNVLYPIVAVMVCKVFSLHPAVMVALVTLAIAPVGAMFSQAMLPLVTPGHAAYARGLFFASTVLSVILTPLAPNTKGVDFYKRLTDELRANGIEPFGTLYHWDLPQSLQDKYRGWQSKETARAFADYAGYMAGQPGDRVKHFFTINEFRSFVEGGYQGFDVQVGGGRKVHLGGAPGSQLSNGDLNQVRHHAVLGHGLAVQAIRASGRAGTKVGFAENMLTAVPVTETPECVKAAERATRELNADFTTVMLEGRYTDDYLTRNGKDAPTFADGELKTIGSPLDFVGINVYKPIIYVMPSDEAAGYRSIPINTSHPKMQSAWHVFDPECTYWAPHHLQSLWGVKSIFITENGCGASDVVGDDGKVYDSDRIMFLRAYLTQLQRATADGVPVSGYFLWSAQDNFEWIDGFGTRFGLVYVDFKTQKRTPKLSAQWFREAAAHNMVV